MGEEEVDEGPDDDRDAQDEVGKAKVGAARIRGKLPLAELSFRFRPYSANSKGCENRQYLSIIIIT